MKFLRLSLLLLGTSILINSCVKRSYDNPPDTSAIDPNIPTNATIGNFASMGLNMTSGQYRVIGDSTISGVVVADDRSGNFYKQVVIQDASGGIVLGLDKTYLYNDYPVGRKIYVKLKGLTLINYKGLPEITNSVSATGSTTGIPSSLIINYVVKASYPNTVTPADVSINDLLSNISKYYNTLIRISDMQFDNGNYGVPYAASTASGAFATSRTITNCSHTASLVMYNSSFANFQPYLTPAGNGKVTCICSNYSGTLQLLIRDTTDVQFTSPRCP